MKKIREFKEEKVSEFVAASIIVGSLLLCVVLSFVGFLDNRQKEEQAVQNVNAKVEPQSRAKPEADGYRQLDDPMLVLVNEDVPLPDDWKVTPRMIDDEQVDLRMYEDLTAMIDAGAKEDVWFWIASGYRSVEQQEMILERAIEDNIKKGMNRKAAREEALKTIAEPGHSEHHTGLAVDLNDVSDDFEQTKAYRWLSEHAAEYGFVQRYQKDKVDITGIDNESWHYRYVGPEHAQEMKRLNLCLEEYVAYLWEKE